MARGKRRPRNKSGRILPALLLGVLGIAPLSIHSAAGEDHVLLGLPPMTSAQNATDGKQIELGRKLFFDRRLSASGTVSCASCHQPGHALSDGLPVSRGDRGQTGTRNAPSLINVRFNNSFFWDGRRATLEEQAIDPFLNPREHGLRGRSELLERIKKDPAYVHAFFETYRLSAGAIEIKHVTQAIAGFERTLAAGDSPFDRYYYKGEKRALSESAARGLAIFQGRAKCASCHVIGNEHALFTDFEFHSLSVGTQAIEQRLVEITTKLVASRAGGKSLDQTITNDRDIAELGRFAVTLKPADIGKFRTPSLRNVAVTGPYMHNGSVKTLEEAVELEVYYRGVENGYPLILTLQERDDLIAFLRSLTSPHLNRWNAPGIAHY